MKVDNVSTWWPSVLSAARIHTRRWQAVPTHPARGSAGGGPALVAVAYSNLLGPCCHTYTCGIYISRSALIPFSGWLHCPAPKVVHMFCIYFWGNFGRGRFLSFTLIFKIYARASSKSQSKQNKCRADNLSRLATLESPKTQAQAQAQAQPETEGDLALLAKSGHAWSVAKECATFRVFAESSRATCMCRVEKGWGGAKEISQEPADLVELGGKSGGQMGQRFATEMSEAVTPQNWSWSLSCSSVRYTARKPKWIYIYMNVLNA